jgi:hypothetical protein
MKGIRGVLTERYTASLQGFLWMSNAHTTAYYWSHAGQHFEIRDEGDWCVCLGPVSCHAPGAFLSSYTAVLQFSHPYLMLTRR